MRLTPADSLDRISNLYTTSQTGLLSYEMPIVEHEDESFFEFGAYGETYSVVLDKSKSRRKLRVF